MLKLTKPLAFIDLEATGTNLGTDRIVEIAIIKILPDGTRSVKRKLINPEIPIPKASSDLHGITNEMVKDAPTFKQVANDFSGNKLPSVAPNTVAATLDIMTRPGIYTNITWYYSDAIPLNDANTEFASSYNLTGIRAGWRKHISKKINLDVFAGVDNLFDVQYSLGNDINAAANRFYNAAAGVNYFGGVVFGLTY